MIKALLGKAFIKNWWEHTGSNRGPSACKADALNQLSYAPFRFWDCKDTKLHRFSKGFFKNFFLQCNLTKTPK